MLSHAIDHSHSHIVTHTHFHILSHTHLLSHTVTLTHIFIITYCHTHFHIVTLIFTYCHPYSHIVTFIITYSYTVTRVLYHSPIHVHHLVELDQLLQPFSANKPHSVTLFVSNLVAQEAHQNVTRNSLVMGVFRHAFLILDSPVIQAHTVNLAVQSIQSFNVWMYNGSSCSDTTAGQ